MNWIKRIYIKIKVWLKLATELEKIEDILKGLSDEEKIVGKFLLESGIEWSEIAATILSNRDRRKLRRLIKKHYPNISDREISSLLEDFSSELGLGFSPKKIFEEKINPHLTGNDTNTLKNKN